MKDINYAWPATAIDKDDLNEFYNWYIYGGPESEAHCFLSC